MSENSMLEAIPFSEDEVRKLFKIARSHILAALRKERAPELAVNEPRLQMKRGVFVTLTNNGHLRGCLGHFGADYPLCQIVKEMSVASATQDYRFFMNPVTEKEMENIRIKISILSELQKVDSPDAVEVGKHGIWIKQGRRSGTYLPEVATELGWNREQFLTSCCSEKAGLAPDAWRKDAEIYVYTSQILDESEWIK